MTNGWTTARLGELASFKTGKLDSNAARPNGAYPFFTCSQQTLRTETYAFDTECVLLAGNNANGIYPLKYYKGKFDAYQRTYVIRSLNTDRLLNRFLYYALRPKLDLLKSISTGAATKFLTLTLLNGLEIDFPEIATQERIVCLLSVYDDLIENNERRIRILEEMAQALYREWFVHFRFPGHEKVKLVESSLGRVPQRWEVRKLGDVIELAYGKALKAEERSGGLVPVFGSSGIVGFHDRPLAKGPGIIVGRKGNVGSIFWTDSDFHAIDTVFFVRTKLSLPYVFYNLRDQNFINNDAAVPGLSRNAAYLKSVLVPDTDTMNAFEEVITIIFNQLRVMREKSSNLRRTRDLLLPKLICGEIHPASG